MNLHARARPFAVLSLNSKHSRVVNVVAGRHLVQSANVGDVIHIGILANHSQILEDHVVVAAAGHGDRAQEQQR
jgi:hypothetical protein